MNNKSYLDKQKNLSNLAIIWAADHIVPVIIDADAVDSHRMLWKQMKKWKQNKQWKWRQHFINLDFFSSTDRDSEVTLTQKHTSTAAFSVMTPMPTSLQSDDSLSPSSIVIIAGFRCPISALMVNLRIHSAMAKIISMITRKMFQMQDPPIKHLFEMWVPPSEQNTKHIHPHMLMLRKLKPLTQHSHGQLNALAYNHNYKCSYSKDNSGLWFHFKVTDDLCLVRYDKCTTDVSWLDLIRSLLTPTRPDPRQMLFPNRSRMRTRPRFVPRAMN